MHVDTCTQTPAKKGKRPRDVVGVRRDMGGGVF